jgi:annexin A13
MISPAHHQQQQYAHHHLQPIQLKEAIKLPEWSLQLLETATAKMRHAAGIDKLQEDLALERHAHELTKQAYTEVEKALMIAVDQLRTATEQLEHERTAREALQKQCAELEIQVRTLRELVACRAEDQERKACSVKDNTSWEEEETWRRTALADCEEAHEALSISGMWTWIDEERLVHALADKSNKQLQFLKRLYLSQYGVDLMKSIQRRSSGAARTLLLALLHDPVDYQCELLHRSLTSQFFTDENALIDVLCTSSNQEITTISATYLRIYGRTLDESIQHAVSGDLRRLLAVLLLGNRTADEELSGEHVLADVHALYLAAEGRKKHRRLAPDAAPFIQILGTRSPLHLAAINAAYVGISKRQYNLERTISRQFSGTFRKALIAVLRSQTDQSSYWSEVLHHALVGFGVDLETLTRVVALRRERDWDKIKEMYNTMYRTSLKDRLVSSISGPYRRAVFLALHEPL